MLDAVCLMMIGKPNMHPLYNKIDATWRKNHVQSKDNEECLKTFASNKLTHNLEETKLNDKVKLRLIK